MAESVGSPLVSLDHEALLVRRGVRSGVYTVIAVHSTVLGPALGGCRMTSYASAAEAVRDALRLARGMTYKSAAAGLPLGGGKSVIAMEPEVDREAMLLDLADSVESLGGQYIAAEDVGTKPADMELIRTRTEHVVGLPPEQGGVGDPSPYTAAGVEAAMRACVGKRFGSEDFDGRSVAIVGVGSVGAGLARMLAEQGAKLILADIDEGKRGLAEELGARWTDPESAMIADADVLAPCALGGVLDESTIPALRCRIVCGAANNQLLSEELADDLHKRGILYAPDFIANAGGIIHAAEEQAGEHDPDRVALMHRVHEAHVAILWHKPDGLGE
jgi:leucine dehydrogenase